MHLPDLQAQLSAELPYPMACHVRHFEAGTALPPHASLWGEFCYALNGMMEFMIDGQPFLSPPQYALWIPPGVRHHCSNRHAVQYATIYVARDICTNISAVPCTATLTTLMRAIVQDFDQRGIIYPETAEDLRLAQVFIDQLRLTPTYSSYLPWTEEPALAPLLGKLQQQPADKHGADYWAESLGITERTLQRYCQKHLGMSFNDWRQRLRLVHAISLLQEGLSVQEISIQLGYSSASAFISMFQRLTGMSPERMRKSGHLSLEL